MPKASTRDRKPKIVIDEHDEVEVSSIDSFPASDPPGWIETTARPSAGGGVAAGKERPAEARKGAKRGASR